MNTIDPREVLDWFSDYGTDNSDLYAYEDMKVIYAQYGQGSYEGEVFVLFERDGEMYEVNGGHCSCYGLEGQWDPERTSREAIEHRLIHGRLGQQNYCMDDFRQELADIMGVELPDSEED